MELGLAGRTALITGSSKGIGLAIAERFAAEGVNLVLVARDEENLKRSAQKIGAQANVQICVRALDLSRSSGIVELAREFPAVDIVVNNAGAIPQGNLADMDEARWRDAWDLKVFGYINMTRAFYAPMKARRRGVILNIIGAGGERLDANYICGSTANAALMAFTRALGAASPADGVRVLAINPGAVATDRLVVMMRRHAEERFGDSGRWPEMVKSASALGRAATPDEIAASAVFLTSDLSGYTSGTVLTIDGGYVHRQVR